MMLFTLTRGRYRLCTLSCGALEMCTMKGGVVHPKTSNTVLMRYVLNWTHSLISVECTHAGTKCNLTPIHLTSLSEMVVERTMKSD